jgi:hypothetical protein
VAALARAGRPPGRASLRSAALGSSACPRARTRETGRAWREGARRSNELHFRSDWSSINAQSAVTISRGILNDD